MEGGELIYQISEKSIKKMAINLFWNPQISMLPSMKQIILHIL